jgi:hypothetical protein
MSFKYKTPKKKYKEKPRKSPKKLPRKSPRKSYNKNKYDSMKKIDLTEQYNYYKKIEYVFDNTYINSKKYSIYRAESLNYIIDICFIFDYNLYTYFTACAIFDKFMLKYIGKLETIKQDYLKLISVTSLFISAKFHGVYHESINDVYSALVSPYNGDNIIESEREILFYLRWEITLPTSYYFLQYYINKGLVLMTDNLVKLSEYILCLLTMDINSLKFKPSLLALCSLLVADEKINIVTHVLLELWKSPLIEFTGYNIDEINECKLFIVNMLKTFNITELSSLFQEDYDSVKGFIFLK